MTPLTREIGIDFNHGIFQYIYRIKAGALCVNISKNVMFSISCILITFLHAYAFFVCAVNTYYSLLTIFTMHTVY